MSSTSPPIAETWNLSDLYPDEVSFRIDCARFSDELLEKVDAHKGRLLASATSLAETLESISAARELLQRLHCFASLKADGDTRHAENQATRQEMELLGIQLSERSSFLAPEILAGEPDIVERYLDVETRLAPYAYFLRDLLRQRKHVLGPSEERILAETGLIRRDPDHLYQLLVHAELPRPEIRLSTGETVRVDTVNFQKHRTSPVREDRQKLFPAYFSAYASFRETLGQNLYASVKGHLFRARVRRYDSCLEAALEPDHVPEAVYRVLIQQVRARLPLFHRYLQLRAQTLGLDRLEYADLYCPLTANPAARHEAADAERIVMEGMAPLGEGYSSALARAFASRWIDWRPSPGKRSGAYATGWAYRIHPYVLLNFNGDYDGVMTLAHEMGHAMHSFFSNGAQPFPTADYSIFVAEVASTFNESLVLRRMLADAEGEDELFLLSSYLDGIRGTLFRQTMFAEFELEIHERAERGEVLNGERMSEIYLRLLREYHGHDAGVMHIDDAYAIEWAAIPHMYFDFYVYQYATGIVAAHALAEGVASGDDDARARYLRFLRSGGSDDPLDLLRAAGVDLESEAPYVETFQTIERRLGRLESSLSGATTG